MFAYIGKYLTAIKIGLFLALCGAVVALFFMWQSAAEDNAVKQKAISELSTRMGDMQEQIESEQKRNQELAETRNQINQRYRKTLAELQSYEGKEELVLEQPGMVEDKMQESFDGFMREMQCATGEVSQCPE